MKLAIQYVNDSKGRTKAVQMSLTEWERVLLKLKKYEQTLKIKSDLKEAFAQIALIKRSRAKRQTLSDLLDEL